MVAAFEELSMPTKSFSAGSGFAMLADDDSEI